MSSSRWNTRKHLTAIKHSHWLKQRNGTGYLSAVRKGPWRLLFTAELYWKQFELDSDKTVSIITQRNKQILTWRMLRQKKKRYLLRRQILYFRSKTTKLTATLFIMRSLFLKTYSNKTYMECSKFRSLNGYLRSPLRSETQQLQRSHDDWSWSWSVECLSWILFHTRSALGAI